MEVPRVGVLWGWTQTGHPSQKQGSWGPPYQFNAPSVASFPLLDPRYLVPPPAFPWVPLLLDALL